MQKVLHKVDRALQEVKRQLPPGRRKIKEAELWEAVGKGTLAEQLLANPSWVQLLAPWLEKKRKKGVDILVNYRQRRFKNDVPCHFERGQVHIITELKAFLKETANLKTQAEQELKRLRARGQPEKEKE